MAKAKLGKGLRAKVLGRMAATETLISDRHANNMLVGLLTEAEQVVDPVAAWDVVRTEVCESWGFDEPTEGRKPFIYNDGVAIIPVHGILINRFNHCWGFVTGYDFIRRQKNLAEADEDVKFIVYDHDTPGGEAAGCDELAREIFAGRSVKPSLAIVNTLSASGGYWLAAPCSRIICAPSGSVGSIGVYIQHMNIAKMFAEYGVEVEFIKRGKFKTSGNQFEELSAEDRAYLQSMVDERYDEFVAAVAEFRGIEESVARDTEARVMRPTEALSLGLIDAAIAPGAAVSDYLAEMGNDDINEDESEEQTMADPVAITAEQTAEIANAAKARIKGIMTSEEAKGRSGLAEHLAYNTDQTVEQAVATLAVSAKDPEPVAETEEEDDDGAAAEAAAEEEAKAAAAKEAAKGKTNFESAMDKGKHPEVGADGTESAEGVDKVAQILGAQSLATGRMHGEDKKKS